MEPWKFVNLTPHAINVEDRANGATTTFPPSGTVARVAVRERPLGRGIWCVSASGPRIMRIIVPIGLAEYGAVENLPPPKPNTFYIVSTMVREACPERADLLSPGAPIRDSEGRVIGAGTLIANPCFEDWADPLPVV